MNKIQKISFYLGHFLTIVMVLWPMCLVVQWLFIDQTWMKDLLREGMTRSPISIPGQILTLDTISWTSLTQAIGLIGDMVGFSPLFLGFFFLKSIFRRYRYGVIFSIENARDYRVLGGLFFLDGLISRPVSDFLMVLAATFENDPGQRIISIGFGTSNLESLFCGFFIMMISWVMIEGNRLNDDQKLTI